MFEFRDKVARDVDRDYSMGPEPALEYGMIDHVIASRGAMPPTAGDGVASGPASGASR